MNRIKTKLIKFLSEDSAGSAIILALIIIAGLAGTGLGAARLTQQNTQLNTEYEDSLKAFYAAEAGIESALLEWRFDHDVEFWDGVKARGCANNPTECKDEDLKVKKCVTLDDSGLLSMQNDNQLVKSINCSEGDKLRGKPWYELKIYYREPKNPYLGVFANSLSLSEPDGKFYFTTDDLPSVKKDETREISFPKSDNVSELFIKWAAAGLQPASSEYMRLLVHTVAEDANGKTCMVGQMAFGGGGPLVDCGSGTGRDNVAGKGFYTGVATTNGVSLSDLSYNPIIIGNNAGLQAITDVRIKCLASSTKLDSKAYIAVAAYGGAGELVHMPSAYTTIESVGHYNNVERKVIYKIDRQSGTIINVYDFGLMSKETLRK